MNHRPSAHRLRREATRRSLSTKIPQMHSVPPRRLAKTVHSLLTGPRTHTTSRFAQSMRPLETIYVLGRGHRHRIRVMIKKTRTIQSLQLGPAFVFHGNLLSLLESKTK